MEEEEAPWRREGGGSKVEDEGREEEEGWGHVGGREREEVEGGGVNSCFILFVEDIFINVRVCFRNFTYEVVYMKNLNHTLSVTF